MLTTDNIQDIYPLSPLQEGMYFYSLYNQGSHAYFEQVSYTLKGVIDQPAFKESLEKLFARHDILRTVFNHQKVSRPLQVVLRKVPVALYFQDIRDLPEKEQTAFIADFKSKDLQAGFDLTRDLLMRVNVLRTGEEAFMILWSYHHILMDGWCVSLLVNEFYQLYHSILYRQPVQLPVVTQYKTYIKWLTERNNKASRLYWSQYLQGYSIPSFIPAQELAPTATDDGPRAYIPGQKAFMLDPAKRKGLDSIVVNGGVTWSNLIQTIWGIMLAKYNQVQDVIFGLVVAGRPAEMEAVESMIGLFINTIPVRLQCTAQAGFMDVLRSIHKASIEAQPHHYEQLSDIQSLSELRNGLIDHILVFDNYPLSDQLTDINGQADNDKDAMVLSDVETFEQTNYDLNVLVNLGDKIWINFNYNDLAYPEKRICQIWDDLNLIIDQVLDDPDRTVASISLVPEIDKDLIFTRDDDFINARYRHLYPGQRWQPLLSGKKICLLDAKGQLLPAGINGEICIDAEGLEIGFWHQNDFNPGGFIQNPFLPAEKLFRTGDIGFWRTDGCLEYRGRKDEEFLVRGYRVESFRIKEALLSHDKIYDAEILVTKNAVAAESLTAFYTSDHSLDVITLRQIVGKRLPAYMVPDRFIHLQKFPVTLAGDVDKDALIKVQRTTPEDEPDYTPPAGEVEEMLAAIWSEVLGQEQIGVNSNFFRIMGNSIKAIQIISRMNKAGYKVSMKSIFNHPTIRELAAILAISAGKPVLSKNS